MDYKVFMGIDISKRTIDVALKTMDNLSHQQFTNDTKGYKEMLQWISKKVKDKRKHWVFCMEHTGIYGLGLACFLQSKQLDFSVEAPYHIKHSMGLQRGKNDKVDAKRIARYAYLHREELSLSSFPDTVIIKLQALLAYRSRLVKAIMTFKIPSKELSEFVDSNVKSHINKQTDGLIKCIKSRIKKVEKEIQKLIESDQQIAQNYELAQSVKGVGPIIAAYMIIYTRNFTVITNSKAFASYCGVAPFEHSSGSSIRGKTSVSHHGNKKLKALLNNGAWQAVRFDNEIRGYYDRKVTEGKHKLSVINAVKNKMISRVFAVVKRGTPYVVLANHSK